MPPMLSLYVKGLSFYTLARAPHVPGTRAGPSPGRHVASQASLMPLSGLSFSCSSPSTGQPPAELLLVPGLWLRSQGNLKDKSPSDLRSRRLGVNVRHGGWQIFGGKRLNLVPLQSLHEMVEFLWFLKILLLRISFYEDRSFLHREVEGAWILVWQIPAPSCRVPPSCVTFSSQLALSELQVPPWRSVRIRGSVLEALGKWCSHDYSVQMQHSLADKHSGFD